RRRSPPRPACTRSKSISPPARRRSCSIATASLSSSSWTPSRPPDTAPPDSPKAMANQPPPTPMADNLAVLLARPLEQRKREQQYRFAQSVVFGLPVIALQLWGHKLGPIDAQRWASVMQLLLAGWVMYVNLGMVFEG